MEISTTLETALRILVIISIGAFFASRRERKAELDNADYVQEELPPQTHCSICNGDAKLHQEYYISLGHDMDSSFYEVRQYEEDRFTSTQPVPSEWMVPYLPGIDRDLSQTLKGSFSEEKYSGYWQRIFVLKCGHNLACIHAIDSTTENTYCFICRTLQIVHEIVKRQEVFPEEGGSINSREEWIVAREKMLRDE